MDNFQYIGIAILAVFYGAYFIKMLGQRKKGIKTTQFGKGNKLKKTIVTEKSLQAVSILVVAAEACSIFQGSGAALPGWLRALGLALAAFGTLVFLAAMHTMQDSWRAGIPEKETTALVTEGIFKISRNPAFLEFDSVYIGLCLCFFQGGLLAVSLLGALLLDLQIREEEQFLQQAFGEEYLSYRKKVGRYFLWF